MCTQFQAIMQSMWRAKLYTLFWFLLVEVLLLIVVICILSVIMTFKLLRSENYCWWWRSFWTGASGGFYLMIYAIVYLFAELDVRNFDSDMVYLVYMVLFIGEYSLMAGTVSVIASYIFVEYLYTGIRGD